MTTVRASEEDTAIILADCPWPHANGSRTNSGKSPKYPLMNLREIAAVGDAVAKMAGPHAVLYLWATAPHLPGAIDTIMAWGFRYRSYHVWRKTKLACGFWVRSNAELLLIGERGAPSPPKTRSATIFDGKPEAALHSAKPDAAHRIIESQWPHARKIELFARRPRARWQTYGSDLGVQITPSGLQASSLQKDRVNDQKA